MPSNFAEVWRGETYYQDQAQRGNTHMSHNLEEFVGLYRDLILNPIHEEIAQAKGETSTHISPLLDTEVLVEWVE